MTRNQILVIGTADIEMNDKLSVRYIFLLSVKKGKMLYSRCFDDPIKCRDLVPGRVSSIRYIIGYSCKAVTSEVGKASVYYTNQNGGGCLSNG